MPNPIIGPLTAQQWLGVIIFILILWQIFTVRFALHRYPLLHKRIIPAAIIITALIHAAYSFIPQILR